MQGRAPGGGGGRRAQGGQVEALADGPYPGGEPGRPHRVRGARAGAAVAVAAGPVGEVLHEGHHEGQARRAALALVEVPGHVEEGVGGEPAAHRGGAARGAERPGVGLVGAARQLPALEEFAEAVPAGLVEAGGAGQDGPGRVVVEEGARVPVPVDDELRQLPALAASAQFPEAAVDGAGGVREAGDAVAHGPVAEFGEQGLGEPARPALGVVLRGLALAGGVKAELAAPGDGGAAPVVGAAEVPAGVAGRVDPAGVHQCGLEREPAVFDEVGLPPAQRGVEVEVADAAGAGVGAGQHQLPVAVEVAVPGPEDPQEVAVALREFVEQHGLRVLLGRGPVRVPERGQAGRAGPVEPVGVVERGQQQPDVRGGHLAGPGQPAGEAQGVAGGAPEVPAVADLVRLHPGDQREGAAGAEGGRQEPLGGGGGAEFPGAGIPEVGIPGVGGPRGGVRHPMPASATACSMRS
ncbi:hypothetical protein ACFXB4_31450 [Streptomyces lavendulae]|uniref:hypothetical protein n=1 Tax=Streptomyces lavendulae TaxID=1914 RepID=UPI0036AD1696